MSNGSSGKRKSPDNTVGEQQSSAEKRDSEVSAQVISAALGMSRLRMIKDKKDESTANQTSLVSATTTPPSSSPSAPPQPTMNEAKDTDPASPPLEQSTPLSEGPRQHLSYHRLPESRAAPPVFHIDPRQHTPRSGSPHGVLGMSVGSAVYLPCDCQGLWLANGTPTMNAATAGSVTHTSAVDGKIPMYPPVGSVVEGNPFHISSSPPYPYSASHYCHIRSARGRGCWTTRLPPPVLEFGTAKTIAGLQYQRYTQLQHPDEPRRSRRSPPPPTVIGTTPVGDYSDWMVGATPTATAVATPVMATATAAATGNQRPSSFPCPIAPWRRHSSLTLPAVTGQHRSFLPKHSSIVRPPLQARSDRHPMESSWSPAPGSNNKNNKNSTTKSGRPVLTPKAGSTSTSKAPASDATLEDLGARCLERRKNKVPYFDASVLEDPSPEILANRRTRGGVSEPFPEKLHRMLELAERDGHDDVVSFLSHGRAFGIHKPKQFSDEIMPKYFKQSRLSSFQRQLNLYGFTRINTGPDTGGYYHELFLRGRPALSIHIRRVGIPKGAPRRRGVKAHDSTIDPNLYSIPPIRLHPQAVNPANTTYVEGIRHSDAGPGPGPGPGPGTAHDTVVKNSSHGSKSGSVSSTAMTSTECGIDKERGKHGTDGKGADCERIHSMDAETQTEPVEGTRDNDKDKKDITTKQCSR